ncbi:hypothetical protein DVH24_027392, partial [Malus domestica]
KRRFCPSSPAVGYRSVFWHLPFLFTVFPSVAFHFFSSNLTSFVLGFLVLLQILGQIERRTPRWSPTPVRGREAFGQRRSRRQDFVRSQYRRRFLTLFVNDDLTRILSRFEENSSSGLNSRFKCQKL